MTTSDIDYGLEGDLESYFNDPVHQSNEFKVELKQDEIKNPLFLPIGGINIDTTNAYKFYKRVIVLCRRNTTVQKYDNLINKCVLTRTEFDSLTESYELVIGSLNMIKNKTHMFGISVIDICLLEQFNHNGIQLENEELVICLTELTIKDFYEYRKLYNNNITVKNIDNLLFLHRYFNCSTYYPTSIELSKLILHIKDTSYWKNPTNCNINITNEFTSRLFNLTYNNDNILASTKSIKRRELDKLIDELKLKNNCDSDYPHSTMNFYDKSKLNKHYYTFNNNDNIDLTKDQVTTWFGSITDTRIKFSLFVALMLSKKYCHLVFNNAFVLTSMEDIIQHSLPFMRYIFGYANLYLYLDEYLSGSYSTLNSRHVFTLETANKLPFFPYSTHDPHLNPYVSLLVNETDINFDNNMLGIPMNTNNIALYGLDTTENFKKKLNLFLTGDIHKDIFQDLNWDKGYVLCGSCIPACTQKWCQLSNIYSDNESDPFDAFARFYSAAFKTSDIDIMCKEDSVFEYMDRVKELITVVAINLGITEDFLDSFEFKPIKTLRVNIKADYFEKYMYEFIKLNNKKEFDMEYVINNINNNVIKEHFYQLYIEHKLSNNRKIRMTNLTSEKELNILYEYFYNPVPMEEMDIRIRLNNVYRRDDEISDCTEYFYDSYFSGEKENEDDTLLIKIEEGIRFKISSPQLNHEIEIFKINDIDFMASVNRFHLGCVRGCYNGETVNMISSCKDALLTNINYDFRYSSGERHPCEITNKYMSRGQSIILNKTELEHTIEYNKIKDNHNGMFKLEDDDNKLLGPKLINNDMFKHLKYYDGLPDDVYIQVEENGFVTSEEEFYKAYKMICGYEPDGGIDFLKFKTINKDGNIEPVKMWLIDAAYEYFF